MKKIILLAAFSIAGLASANSSVVQNKTVEEKSEVKKENATKALVACAPVTYSCGVKGWACGSTTLEMIANVWDGESLFCG